MAVKSLENAKHLLAVFRIDSDSVVFHAELPVSIPGFRRHVNHRWFCASVLDGISDQVLKELHHSNFVSLDFRQRAPGYRRIVLFDGELKILGHSR